MKKKEKPLGKDSVTGQSSLAKTVPGMDPAVNQEKRGGEVEKTPFSAANREKRDRNAEKIQFLTVTAIFIALTYVFTAFVNVRLPIAANGGLIHLGNIPLFIGAIIFGKKTGMISGAVGMALFDLLSGWTLWAPFTFVIVGLMGFVVGWMTEKPSHQKFGWYAAAIAAACVIKVVGYYIAEAIIYGNRIAPVTSIPGNLVQIGVAAVITLAIVGRLNKAAVKIGLK